MESARRIGRKQLEAVFVRKHPKSQLNPNLLDVLDLV